MRCVKSCKESTGRMKKHRYSKEFKVTAVKLANAPGIETQPVAVASSIYPFMLPRWKKGVPRMEMDGSGPSRPQRGAPSGGVRGRAPSQPSGSRAA